MFDGTTWRHWTHTDGLGADNIQQLPISHNTGLGTRSRHDLSVMVDGGESFNPNYVFAVHIAPDDRIWAGTWGGGVSVYDGQKWMNFTTQDGLAGNIVYSIAQGQDGVLWFGTNHGLTSFDGQSWQSYAQADGLLGDDVYAIAIAADNSIWVGTKRGVTQLANDQQGEKHE